MAERIGYTTPENMRLILEVVRYMQAAGFISRDGQRGDYSPKPPTPIYVQNDSGEEIPAYACMQVTGTIESSGQNYLVVNKPVDSTMDDGAYVFNMETPIEIDGNGTATSGPVFRAKYTGTITPTALYAPTAAQWYLTKNGGGIYRCLGDDDVGTSIGKFQLCNGPRIYAGQSSGSITAASGSTLGSGSVVLKKIPSGSASNLSPSQTITAYNPAPTTIASGQNVVVMREFESGEWMVIAGSSCNPVVDVYIDSGYLKQAFCDGTIENIVALTSACP